ncbi:MAG: VTT domain-containing protein [Chloroflexi bacterium]|nr:VTT domain-containing protein [Chloroflexota bacterium]
MPAAEASHRSERLMRIAARRSAVIRLAVLGLIGAYLVLIAALWLAGRFQVETIGYPGVWVFAFIGASSIILPVPGLAAVCAAAAPAAGLHPAAIGLVAASAEALGEMTGYLAGVTGESFVQRNRLYPKVKAWVLRRGGLVFLLMSAFPNPLFDLLGVAAGSVRYPIRKFILFTFVGKAVKSTWVAYGCYLGIGAIQRMVS